MAHTNSLAFPNMLDPTRNTVAVLDDNASIVNRVRLLILTDPTELYNNPKFGVGLKRYLWQYNNDNVRAMIQDRIKLQLAEHEPCVDASSTQFADGLLFSGDSSMSAQSYNELKMTVAVQTIYKDTVTVDVSEANQ